MASNRQQHQVPERRSSASPFPGFRSDGRDDGFILRTRSLDEVNPPTISRKTGINQQSDHIYSENTKCALHSSFDTSPLEGGVSNDGYSFEYDDRGDASNAWEEGDMSLGDISGKKHLRPPGGLETVESRPPGTVRKLARRTGTELNSKTPGRPPPRSLKKPSNLMPSSAVKRRRAPLHRLSPMGRVPLSTTPSIHTQPAITPTIARRFEHGAAEDSSTGASFPTSSQALTPTRTLGLGSTGKSTSKWNTTCTTVATTLLETTLESDSAETSSPASTRFRFSSFPASLPRINNPRNRNLPDSVRKRMSLRDGLGLDESNQSRDDDGTHNTSISSLSADGPTNLTLPPCKPLAETCLYALGNVDIDGPVHTQRLFSGDDNFGYSDDDATHSPAREVVGRTRLNFNMVLSPERHDLHPTGNRASGVALMDLTRPYDQTGINSFQSSLSSTTNMNIEVADTFTPGRSSDITRPRTPREVQLLFPLGSECSPIPGSREDLGGCDPDCTKRPELSPGLLGDDLVSRDTRPPDQRSSTAPKPTRAREHNSVASDSTNERTRCLRPMPDISAFESAAMSPRGERSTDDSATVDSKGVLSSHRFLCPPTPVRTPAWATENSAHAFFAGRQNSLITTKVLLSCPSQVLVGRCSLESAVLDDESRGGDVQKVNRGQNSTTKMPSDAADLKHAERKHDVDGDYVASTIQDQILAPPQLTRRFPASHNVSSVISFSNDFKVLGVLGSGAFADVYKVRSVRDNHLYAVKRNRRQFRGKRDRDMALSEVQCMQRLQSTCITEPRQASDDVDSESMERNSYSLYLLFFYNAWQEDGYFFCQTELCCRDTCRELLDSIRFLWHSSKRKYPSLLRNLPAPLGVESDCDCDASGRSVPITTIWKICHDISAGLSHIHSHGVVHNDIKPSNIFFVDHPRFGAMCKIGDFGMAGNVGSHGDGQEGDARYMPLELLKSGTKHPSSDVFSLGLTLYELANDERFEIPSGGPRWHDLRSEAGIQLPNLDDNELVNLIKQMTNPEETHRQTADAILKFPKVKAAGYECDEFLRDYLRDIEEFDRVLDERLAQEHHDEQTPRNGSHRSAVAIRSPGLSVMLPSGPNLLSPLARPFY